jgi:hypothetical protein
MHAADAASGLPAKMLVGVSATIVYGFAAPTRHSEPTALAFQVPRAGLTVKVHQRVNVRVLELIDDESGSRIELEGNRLPVTHPTPESLASYRRLHVCVSEDRAVVRRPASVTFNGASGGVGTLAVQRSPRPSGRR